MKRLAFLLIGVASFFASTVSSEAAFIHSGTSALSATPGNANGFVDFSVYRNTGATQNWITDLGLGGSLQNFNVSGAEATVFFYQVRVTDVVDPDLGLRIAAIAPGAGTTWNGRGSLTQRVFNNTLEGFQLPTGTAVDTEAAFIGGSGVGNFLWEDILANQSSTVFFLTSAATQIQGGTLLSTYGTVAGPFANVPVAAPEPGSLLLLGLAMSFGGAGFAWKRRKQKLAKDAAVS